MRTPAQIAKMTAPSEHLEQVKLVTLLLGPLVPHPLHKGKFERAGSIHTHKWPELELLYAVPNGSNKSKAQAGMFRAEGLRSAVPDLCLPVPRGPFHGLYVEMKALGKYARPDQRAYMERLREQGYATAECMGCDEAIAVVLAYMSLGWFSNPPGLHAVKARENVLKAFADAQARVRSERK